MTAFRRGEIKKMVTIVNPVSDSEADEVDNSGEEALQSESEGQDSEAYEPKGETEVAIGEAGDDSQEEGSSPVDSTSEIIVQSPEAKEEAAIANEDDAFFERLRIIAELKEARDELNAAQDRMANLVAERKEAKEDLQFCQERVNRLIEKLLDVDNPPIPKIDNRKPVDGTATPLAKVEPPAETDHTPVAAEPDDDSWRKIPTGEVLASVKGLGKKKLEKLVDLYPTLGDLEDLRDQASRGHFEFNEKLPDGFGPTVSDKIQEAIGDAMLKWRREKIAEATQQTKEGPPPGSDFEVSLKTKGKKKPEDDSDSEPEEEDEDDFDDSESDDEPESEGDFDDL